LAEKAKHFFEKAFLEISKEKEKFLKTIEEMEKLLKNQK